MDLSLEVILLIPVFAKVLQEFKVRVIRQDCFGGVRLDLRPWRDALFTSIQQRLDKDRSQEQVELCTKRTVIIARIEQKDLIMQKQKALAFLG